MLVSDAMIAQRIARSSLETAALVERPVRPPVPAPATDVPPRDPLVTRGSAIGALSIPRVHLSAVVLHGSDAQTLRRGPGHLESTALPGDSGNVVIAGHRDSFFWPLRNIQLGDDIFLDTPKRQFHYRVASVRVVNSRDVSVLASTAEPALTLITCYPFWVFGNAPDRFVVRATAVDSSAAVAVTSDETTAGVSTDIATAGPSPVQEMADSDVTTIDDDEVLVRLAVERYRVIYNGRLISRQEVSAAGLVRFETCDVTVTGNRATAACEPVAHMSSEQEVHGRTFMLERAARGWAITSILVD
jgi:LPXTG-site transpeptidase (sortase) family protein